MNFDALGIALSLLTWLLLVVTDFVVVSWRFQNATETTEKTQVVTFSVDFLLGGFLKLEAFCAFLFRGNLEGILSFCEFFAVFFFLRFLESPPRGKELVYGIGGFGLFFLSGCYLELI